MRSSSSKIQAHVGRGSPVRTDNTHTWLGRGSIKNHPLSLASRILLPSSFDFMSNVLVT